MTTSRRSTGWTILRWRRLAATAQAALIVGLPFVRVGGESALRFDAGSLQLHFFGSSIWMNEFFVVLAATLFLTFLFLLVTLAFGRIWCGWTCPQTVLSDLTRFFLRLRRRGGWRAVAGHGLVLGLSTFVGANVIWYFIEPRDFVHQLVTGTMHPAAWGSWAVLAWTLYVDLGFVRERFCTGACPYAKLQGALFDASTLAVAYDRRRNDDCVDCGACARVCPTGIDIRDGLQIECIACGECIDACEPIMRKLGRSGKLVGWFYGDPGTPRRLVRPGVAALAVATAASLALTVGVGATRTPLELVVSPAHSFAPRRTAGGKSVNAYQVAIENRSRETLVVRLGLEPEGTSAALRPEEVRLEPGEHRRLTVVAEAWMPGPTGRFEAIFTAQTTDAQAARRVPFVVPEER